MRRSAAAAAAVANLELTCCLPASLDRGLLESKVLVCHAAINDYDERDHLINLLQQFFFIVVRHKSLFRAFTISAFILLFICRML